MSEKQSKQLLILAGPSCAGKSTLIDKIRGKKLPTEIYESLPIKNLASLRIIEDNDIKRIMLAQLNYSLILHYDLFNNYLNRNYHQNILKIIEQFDVVNVITLSVSNEILLKRIQLRIVKTLAKICLKPSYFKSGLTYFSYQWNKYQRYFRSNIAEEIYHEWFESTQANWVSNHWILDSSQDSLTIKPVRISIVK